MAKSVDQYPAWLFSHVHLCDYELGRLLESTAYVCTITYDSSNNSYNTESDEHVSTTYNDVRRNDMTNMVRSYIGVAHCTM